MHGPLKIGSNFSSCPLPHLHVGWRLDLLLLGRGRARAVLIVRVLRVGGGGPAARDGRVVRAVRLALEVALTLAVVQLHVGHLGLVPNLRRGKGGANIS